MSNLSEYTQENINILYITNRFILLYLLLQIYYNRIYLYNEIFETYYDMGKRSKHPAIR